MIKFTAEEQAIWDTVFKPMLYDKKGLNKKKVIKLLLDHHKNLQEVMKVYHHITNGITVDISLPATKMIEVITELDNKNLEGILKDEKEKWTKEQEVDNVSKVQDTCLLKMIAKLNQFQTSFEVTIPLGASLSTNRIIFDNRDNSILVKGPLPNEWNNKNIVDAIVDILNNPEKKELMVAK